MKVALLGLGNMGAGMAANLLRAGFELTVWNRTAARTEALVAQGARAAATPRAAVADAEVVITCLMDDASILGIVDGDDGILAGLRSGAVHACTMTISPRAAGELAARHVAHGSHYVSAPVVGRPDAAARGELTSLLAGEPDAVARVTPVCRSYSKTVIPVAREPGAANTLKLCMNYLIVSVIETMSEAYTLGEKSGIELEILNDLYASMFAHPALKQYATKLRTRDFDAAGGFHLAGGLKDVGLMLEAARERGVDFGNAAIVEDKMRAALARGLRDHDWSVIHEITRAHAGLG